MIKPHWVNKLMVVIIMALAFIGAVTIIKTAYIRTGDFLNSDSASDVAVTVPKAGAQAKCTDQCTEAVCKDNKTLTECKDTNGDSCKEKSDKACTGLCTGKACATVQEDYELTVNGAIATFPQKITLLTINDDMTVTLEIGNDIFVLSEGDAQVVGTVSVTVISISSDVVNLKVRLV